MGIEAAIIGSAVVGAGASMAAGSKQAKGAEAAAGLHAEATRASIAEQRRQFDLTREDFAPYRDVGQNALLEFASLYGIGRSPAFGQSEDIGRKINELETRGFTTGDYGSPAEVTAAISRLKAQRGEAGEAGDGDYRLSAEEMQAARDRFMETPGYQFRFDEGVRALDRSAAARGSLRGGGHERGLIRYGQGIASDEFSTYANRLAALAGVGQSATGSVSAAGQASAANIGNALMSGAQNQGNAMMSAATARASGYAGAANAISGGANNYLFSQALNNRNANSIYVPTGGNFTFH